jgi:hypothetical protein
MAPLSKGHQRQKLVGGEGEERDIAGALDGFYELALVDGRS